MKGIVPRREMAIETRTTGLAPSRSIIFPIKGRVAIIPRPWGINIKPASMAVNPLVFWKKRGRRSIGPLEAIPARKIPIFAAVKCLDLKNLKGRTVLFFRI